LIIRCCRRSNDGDLTSLRAAGRATRVRVYRSVVAHRVAGAVPADVFGARRRRTSGTRSRVAREAIYQHGYYGMADGAVHRVGIAAEEADDTWRSRRRTMED